jgi:hypothetical protein
MVPVSTDGENIPVRMVAKSTSSAGALYKYSPVYVTSGQVRSAVVGHASAAANGVTGTVEGLLDTNFAPVASLAAATAGWVILTYKPNQTYKMTLSSTHYADADLGNKYYDFGAEASTPTGGYSNRQLDSSTETGTAADGQMLAGGRVPPCAPGINDAATAGTEVFCTINPLFHLAIS